MNIADSIAYERYISRYTDSFGMFALTPWNNVFTSENPYTFTAYMVLAAAHKGVLTPEYAARVEAYVDFTQVMPGLYRRRFIEDESIISHDEYSGLTLMSAVIPNLTQKVNDIVWYGKNYGWQYNDKQPQVNGIPYLKKYTFKAIKELIALAKGDLAVPGEIKNLQYRRQPRDTALYKLFSSTTKASLFERLYLYASFVFTAYGNMGANGGTRLLAYYKILALEMKEHKSLIFKICSKIFRYRMRKDHGVDYIEALHSMYFVDRSHPIHVMVSGMK